MKKSRGIFYSNIKVILYLHCFPSFIHMVKEIHVQQTIFISLKIRGFPSCYNFLYKQKEMHNNKKLNKAQYFLQEETLHF